MKQAYTDCCYSVVYLSALRCAVYDNGLAYPDWLITYTTDRYVQVRWLSVCAGWIRPVCF